MDIFHTVIFGSIIVAVLGLCFTIFKSTSLLPIKTGGGQILKISTLIKQGTRTFLFRSYKALTVVVIVLAVVLAVAGVGYLKFGALSFVLGSLFASLTLFWGLSVATSSNVQAAMGAQEGLGKSFKMAFSGGSVLGINLMSMGLLGTSLLFFIYTQIFGLGDDMVSKVILPVLTGFILGAALWSLFARLMGGIYTKVADVGADLVGKLESGIPEDDPRNPAVIADNVGDMVGDASGMASDLFESYVASLISTMILGASLGSGLNFVVLPLAVASVGVLVSIFCSFFVRVSEKGDPQKAFNRIVWVGYLLMAIICYPLVHYVASSDFFVVGVENYDTLNLYIILLIGFVCGLAIMGSTLYFTGVNYGPVKQIAEGAKTGDAINVLWGLVMGMRSIAIPVILICLSVGGSYALGHFYGVALCTVGMLSIVGLQEAIFAFGPISDNAGGIAEMSGMGEDVRTRTDKLDAVGNATSAIGKGFAAGAAILTGIALFSAFQAAAGLTSINLAQPIVIIGVLLGGLWPFLFASMALAAVSTAAYTMVEEVRRQFREIPGLMDGTGEPDSRRCIDISAKASLKKMIIPSLISFALPLLIGFIFGKEMLGGFVIGIFVSGVCLAIFMSNAGGAWDNAKKSIEAVKGAKGSPQHRAAVTGDIVGDPFKDTAGPSLNILIKLVAIVALMVAPFL